MTAEHLTAVLAERVLRWRSTPDRLLTGKRAWIPRWRFQPLANLDDAFRLIAAAGASYSLMATADGTVTAQVCVGGRTGTAFGKITAATISIAIARAIGINPPDELLEASQE
jgi:hypothetical protein